MAWPPWFFGARSYRSTPDGGGRGLLLKPDQLQVEDNQQDEGEGNQNEDNQDDDFL